MTDNPLADQNAALPPNLQQPTPSSDGPIATPADPMAQVIKVALDSGLVTPDHVERAIVAMEAYVKGKPRWARSLSAVLFLVAGIAVIAHGMTLFDGATIAVGSAFIGAGSLEAQDLLRT
jgi:hypothetical protein